MAFEQRFFPLSVLFNQTKLGQTFVFLYSILYFWRGGFSWIFKFDKDLFRLILYKTLTLTIGVEA